MANSVAVMTLLLTHFYIAANKKYLTERQDCFQICKFSTPSATLSEIFI